MDYALNHLPVKTQSRRWISLLLGDQTGNKQDLVQTRRGGNQITAMDTLFRFNMFDVCVFPSQLRRAVTISGQYNANMVVHDVCMYRRRGTICRPSELWSKQWWDFRRLFMYLFVNPVLSPWKPGALYSFECATHSIPTSQGSFYRSIPQALDDLWIPLSTKEAWMCSDDMISTQLYLIMRPHTHTPEGLAGALSDTFHC